MASIVDKPGDGSRAYLVRFRTSDGQQRSKQFKRKKDADAYVNLVEVDRLQGALIDPRLGRITVGEWWDQWWPTVTQPAAEHPGSGRPVLPHARACRSSATYRSPG